MEETTTKISFSFFEEEKNGKYVLLITVQL